MIKIKNNFFNKILFLGFIISIPISLIYPELRISSWLALTIGIVFTLILGNPYERQNKYTDKYILKTSIVFIGFGYPISSISELSISEFLYVLVFIILTIIIGLTLAKILSVDQKTSDLISSGTAICGQVIVISLY